MPKLNSQTAGEILEITPEAYQQRLSCIRQKMAAFLTAANMDKAPVTATTELIMPYKIIAFIHLI